MEKEKICSKKFKFKSPVRERAFSFKKMIDSCESAKRISDVKDIIPQENGNEKNSTTDLINK